MSKFSQFLYTTWVACTDFFDLNGRFSIGFRLGFWLDHSKNWNFFFRPHSFVDFLWCFGSLTSWKIQTWPKFNFRNEGKSQSFKMACYISEFIVPSMRTILAVTTASKHPQITVLWPPCLTAGTKILLFTYRLLFLPKSSSLVSWKPFATAFLAY